MIFSLPSSLVSLILYLQPMGDEELKQERGNYDQFIKKMTCFNHNAGSGIFSDILIYSQ